MAMVGATVFTSFVGPADESAQAGSRFSKTSRTIRRGLTYIRVRDSQGPNDIRVLRVDPTTDLSVDVALANDTLPGRETTSSMARRHNAIAAINGNFGTSAGRPIGLLAEDGKLHTSPLVPGGAFALSADERAAYVGYQDLKVWGRVTQTGAVWPVSKWNEPSLSSGIAAYTKAGGSIASPPSRSCSVRLEPDGKPTFNKNGRRLSRRYTVTNAACQSASMRPKGGIVLAARQGTGRADLLRSARRGQTVDLGWSIGWQGIVDSIGGSPVLVKDGRVMVDSCSGYVCGRHPRTGVGYMPNGDVLFVTVDGRQRNSVGMEIQDFARLFRYLGAQGALNLDGGGSTTMVLKGNVVNNPSDPSGERPVVSSLLVLPGPDRGQPRGL